MLNKKIRKERRFRKNIKENELRYKELEKRWLLMVSRRKNTMSIKIMCRIKGTESENRRIKRNSV